MFNGCDSIHCYFRTVFFQRNNNNNKNLGEIIFLFYNYVRITSLMEVIRDYARNHTGSISLDYKVTPPPCVLLRKRQSFKLFIKRRKKREMRLSIKY